MGKRLTRKEQDQFDCGVAACLAQFIKLGAPKEYVLDVLLMFELHAHSENDMKRLGYGDVTSRVISDFIGENVKKEATNV